MSKVRNKSISNAQLVMVMVILALNAAVSMLAILAYVHVARNMPAMKNVLTATARVKSKFNKFMKIVTYYDNCNLLRVRWMFRRKQIYEKALHCPH